MEAVIKIHVTVKSRRTEVAGLYGDTIKIRIAAPPVEGRANEELISFLAETLGVPRKEVRIKSGASSRIKTIAIKGIDTDAAKSILISKSAKAKGS